MESAAIGFLALLGLAAVAVCAALLCARPLVAALDGALKRWRRLGIVPRIVVVLMAAVATVEAQKKCSNVGMSECSNVNDSLSTFKHSNIQTFKHYFSLKQVITNDSYSYSKPASAVCYPNWWLRGGYEDVFKLDFGNFRFPIGTNLVDYLWVYIWGKVRPRLKAKELEIDTVDAPLSAVPQVSEFWHTDGTNGSKILTWHNFFIGRIPLSESSVVPISAQLELFPNGDYIARSNLVERYYKRVNPDDRDEDGIPNDIDANPELSDGDFFGPDNDLPEGVNLGNYCWVEIAVSNANSLVTFIGDRPSNLPDPRFIAKAGENYRVNLLIGKTYRVTSAQPITCTAKSSEDINVDQYNERSMTIVYPVSYEIVDNTRSVSRQVRLIPPLVGMYTWNTNTCCETEKPDGPYLPTCAPYCTCEGGCDTGGFTFSYEGYSLDFSGVECGCRMIEPEEDEGPYDASASVSFSKSAIIFENAYENKPGELMPKKSKQSVLSCIAHGGPNGGRAVFTLANAEKLVRVSGVELPIEVDVPAGYKVAFDIVYEGGEASGSESDVVATAQFIDNEDGDLGSVEDELTVVKVELRAVDVARENSCRNRHVFGVHEWVESLHYPSDVSMHIEIQGESNDLINAENTKFFCPWTGGAYLVVMRILNIEYETEINVIEPKIVCREVSWVDIGVLGQSGLMDMRLALYVDPGYVSFKDLFLVEIPDDIECPRSGYFAAGNIEKTGALSHTVEAGAGEWGRVFSDASWMADRVSRATAYPKPWTEGWKEWRIPVGWGDFQYNLKGRITPDPTTQLFTIDSTGVATIRKYGHEIKRTVANRVWIDNVLQN